MQNTKPEIFFHPGLGKTGTTYLQYKFFPKLKGITYIPRTRIHKAIKKLQKIDQGRYLVSREHDRDFYSVTQKFAKHFPQSRIILVFRRHDKWIASQYRRVTKNGRGVTFNEFIDVDKNQGRWDKEILNFYDRILFVEKIFGKKPLVLFHEELKENPYSFFDKIATFTNTQYNKNKLSLSSKHTAYQDNQLKAVRKVARKTFFRRDGINIKHTNGFERKLRKTFCHLIMYFHWLIPLGEERNKPLIPESDLEKIRTAYKSDWERCKQYAEENPVEDII